MILKVYIRNNFFHLPRTQDDLTKQIKEKLYRRKKLIKSSVTKMYPVTKIETSNEENLKHSRNLNIFLLNIYLLYIESKGIEQLNNIKIKLSNENIQKELSKEIDEIKSHTDIDEIEKVVLNYIKNKDKNSSGNKEDKFNMEWVMKMDKKLREGSNFE